MSRSFFLIIVVFFLMPFVSHGQETPVNYSVEFKTAAATDGNLPFWHYTNQWGEVDPSGANAILNTKASKNFFEQSDRWNLKMGAELTSRYSQNPSAFFKQLYAKVDYSIFELQVGRFEDITGNVYKPLSVGSMSFSGNATPLPKIKLGIPEYQPVPLTNGYIEIRGAWGHGWMEEERYTSNALLVEQYGYVRFGGDLPVNLVGGLHHFAFWGGNSRSFGPLPDSFDDYITVAFALGAGGEDATPGDQNYFLGDHKGYWDFGAEIDMEPVKVKLYKQTIFEDEDNLKLKNMQDGLFGLSVESKKSTFIDAFLWEFLYTKWQNGRWHDTPSGYRMGGNDNYYNHSTYRSGWTYFANTIGTPLLFPRDDKLGIANTRVVAHHWGLEGSLSTAQDYELMVTYSRNYGTYDRPIDPRLDSYSMVVSTNYRTEQWQNISLDASLAADFGELYGRNFGLMIGVTWSN